jgi:anion-transporting  ArsA/GET3 family ATPase
MAMTMARVGPLYAKVERMWQLLADPVRTAFNIVTLPEEMSVAESIDLHKAAEELGLPRGKVIVNGVYPEVQPAHAAELRRIRGALPPAGSLDERVASAALDSGLVSVARREAHEEMIAKLAAALPQERLILPFVFGPRIGPEELEALATPLEAL